MRRQTVKLPRKDWELLEEAQQAGVVRAVTYRAGRPMAEGFDRWSRFEALRERGWLWLVRVTGSINATMKGPDFDRTYEFVPTRR